jgi:transposase
MEMKIFDQVVKLTGISPDVICYDTTNFYTYIDEPKHSELSATCHSKDSKHYLQHIGLLMAVEKTYGIPLISRVYRANAHDSKTFSLVLADLIITLKNLCNSESDIVLVLDKGNNSEKNFTFMDKKISWIGALVPSHNEDLIDLDFSKYQDVWKGKSYYQCKKMVMGIECSVVLVFNPATKRKQEHSLRRGVEKLRKEIIKKWKSYKKTPKKITPGIRTMMKKSRYGECLKISIQDGELNFKENKKELEKRKKWFGKNIIFSNMLTVEAGYLIDNYNEKNIIEEDFHLLKDPAIIRFRPIRHWTDTKIRAYAFCCVVSMILMRVMQWKAGQAGYRMSSNVLKEELTDLQEIIMVYSSSDAERRITERSTVQDSLWEIFKLEKIKNALPLHQLK